MGVISIALSKGRILEETMPLLERGVIGIFDGGSRVLVGNPGYSGRLDFEGGSVAALLASHPDRAHDVVRLGLPDGHATAMPDGYAG